MFSRIRNLIKEHRDLRHLAYHDLLTGLYNRNWLYRNLDKINKRYVYFIDINNLHTINQAGHTEGDKHIKNIVVAIQNMIIEGDIFLRYAGDEFLVFSNEKNLLTSNTMFCVGYSIIGKDIRKAINVADKDMIKNKQKRK